MTPKAPALTDSQIADLKRDDPRAFAREYLQPANWITMRRMRIDAAIAFLRSRGVIAEPANRRDLVRHYRVTGRGGLQLAEDVIQCALDLGWPDLKRTSS